MSVVNIEKCVYCGRENLLSFDGDICLHCSFELLVNYIYSLKEGKERGGGA